jgi:hypothetical protein
MYIYICKYVLLLLASISFIMYCYYYYSNHIIIVLNIVIYTRFFVQPFFHDAAWHLPPEPILKAPAHREWAAEGSGSPRDAAYNLNSWTTQGRTSGGWCWVIIYTHMGKHTTWCGKTHGFRNRTTNSRFSTSSMLVVIFHGIFWQTNKTLLMIRNFKKKHEKSGYHVHHHHQEVTCNSGKHLEI